MTEIFKSIPNYENYQVSNLGNVKSLKRNVKHSSGNGFRTVKERILNPTKSSNGYLTVGLLNNNKKKTFNIHQLVMIVFKGHKPDGYNVVIDHKNNIKTDNRLDNLQRTTQRINSSKDNKNGTSKYVGVCWDRNNNRWRSAICINGNPKYLGYFTDEIEASEAYQKELIGIQENKVQKAS